MNTKVDQFVARPEWIRLPRSGALCPWTGLTRTAMDQLVRPQACNGFKPPVRSRILRAKGERRGIRLVDYASLLAHLESLPEEVVQQ
jgi:hypothetical protein